MPFVNGKPANISPWNKGKKGLQVAWNKGLTKDDPRIACGIIYGHPNYNIELKGCFKPGHIPYSKGKGKKQYWNQSEYYILRQKMYEIQKYTCEGCGQRGGRLTLHHLLPVILFPECVYDENNIMVLCVYCHQLTDTWGLRLVRKRGEFKEKLSKLTLSQVREETLEKVQRLVDEAKDNQKSMPVISTMSAPLEREEIV